MSKNQLIALVANTITTSIAFTALLSQPSNQHKPKPVIIVPITISANGKKPKAPDINIQLPTLKP